MFLVFMMGIVGSFVLGMVATGFDLFGELFFAVLCYLVVMCVAVLPVARPPS